MVKNSNIIFMKLYLTVALIMCLSITLKAQTADTTFTATNNPIIKYKFTADPAAMVYKDKVYIYTGHYVAPEKRNGYEMHDWLCFSTGVAVADNPLGPFKDAIGAALVTNDMTTQSKISWDDIDPAVFIDDNKQAYLFWGNTVLYYVKLKENMIEMDGPVKTIDLPHFTEAPWVHKNNGWYYLSYAYEFPEKTAYAMSRSIEGPWLYKGILNEIAGNCNTNHQAIIEFKGKACFIYHNGALVPDYASFHRSVCIDYLYYNKDGTMNRVVMTS